MAPSGDIIAYDAQWRAEGRHHAQGRILQDYRTYTGAVALNRFI
jgi:hypothetical protein